MSGIRHACVSDVERENPRGRRAIGVGGCDWFEEGDRDGEVEVEGKDEFGDASDDGLIVMCWMISGENLCHAVIIERYSAKDSPVIVFVVMFAFDREEDEEGDAVT